MKQAKSILLLMLLLCCFNTSKATSWEYPTNSAGLAYGGGSGTEEDPYLINEPQHLANLAYMVNNGTAYSGKYFRMTNNIILNTGVLDGNGDLNSGDFQSWVPIGGNESSDASNSSKYFSGTFDGDGYYVSGLYISSNLSAVGLFGAVTGGIIKNLGVKDSYISAYSRTGAIVGICSSSTSLVGCYNESTVKTTYWCCGGITGCLYNSNATQCYNGGKITTSNSYVAGIAGASSSANVSYSYNLGQISGGNAAGIISESGVASNCFNYGPATYAITYSSSCVNCYYLSGMSSYNQYAEQKSAEEFADGTVLSLLDPEGLYFVQGPDGYPVLRDVNSTVLEEGADLTERILNPNFTEGNNGWSYSGTGHGGAGFDFDASAGCAEAWNSGDFDIHQDITNLQRGLYEVSVEGFYRRNRDDAAWNYYFDSATGLKKDDIPEVPVFVYMNNSFSPLSYVFDYQVSTADNYYTQDYYTDPDGAFVYPNSMTDAGRAFDHSAYIMSAYGIVNSNRGTLRIGVKGDTTQDGDSWAIFSRFRLKYQGFNTTLLSQELQRAITMIDMTPHQGTDVILSSQNIINDVYGIIAAGDGEAMFNALSNVYAQYDAIEASKSLYNDLYEKLQQLNTAISTFSACPRLSEAIDIYNVTLNNYNENAYTNAEAQAAILEIERAISILDPSILEWDHEFILNIRGNKVIYAPTNSSTIYCAEAYDSSRPLDEYLWIFRRTASGKYYLTNKAWGDTYFVGPNPTGNNSSVRMVSSNQATELTPSLADTGFYLENNGYYLNDLNANGTFGFNLSTDPGSVISLVEPGDYFPSVVSQPTVENPTYDVTLQDYAQYQWYSGESTVYYEDWTSTNHSDGSSDSHTWNFVCQAGSRIIFDWTVSSESSYDYLTITINGQQVVRQSGEQGNTYTYNVTSSGTYTMVASYSKDGSIDRGTDTGYIRNVRVEDGSIPLRGETLATLSPGDRPTTGNYYCVVTFSNSGITMQSDNIYLETCVGSVPENLDYVDLGLLSGVLWANMNLGATNESEPGYFYTWGEQFTKGVYTQENADNNILYNYESATSGYGLGAQYDAANKNWGSDWFTPRTADWQELHDNCTWTWTQQDGTNGMLVTGINGNTIFLPAAGYSGQPGSDNGYYWSSSASNPVIPNFEWFDSSSPTVMETDYYRGMSVRPVYWGLVSGDANCDRHVTVGDLVSMSNCIVGIINLPDENFNFAAADMNSDGRISVADVVLLCNKLMTSGNAASAARRNMPMSTASMEMAQQYVTNDGEIGQQISINIVDGDYSAVQFDVEIPEGLDIDGVKLPQELQAMSSQVSQISDNTYRVIVYSDGNNKFRKGSNSLQLRMMKDRPSRVVSGDVSVVNAVMSTSTGIDNQLEGCASQLDTESATTRVEAVNMQDVMNNGTIVYDLGGRRIKKPVRGEIYIINNQKCLVK